MTLEPITSLDELRRYLQAALQLEHATIPPYLVALYSIHPGTNADAVQVLRTVLVEEMLHLTLSANILNAIGGTVDLVSPGFVPSYPTALPDGETDFQVSRQRFSEEAIKNFLQIERPARAPSAEARTVVHTPPAGSLKARISHDGQQHGFYSIGEFYAEISRGLTVLEEQKAARGETLFIGDRARQVTPGYYYSGGGNVIPVVDLSSAHEAMRLISEQGEGFEGAIFDHEDEISHYYRFQQLQLGRYYLKGDEPHQPSGGKLAIDWNAVYPVLENVRLQDYPQDSETRRAAIEFNAAYHRFLGLLTTAYSGHPSRLLAAVGEMFRIKEHAIALIRNPIPGGGGKHAAPTFEIDEYIATTAGGQEMSQHDEHRLFEGFMAFSAVVTAFSEFKLHGTGQAGTYFSTVVDVTGERAVGELVQAFRGCREEGARKEGAREEGARDEAAMTDRLRAAIFSHDKLGPIARNIIKLWYSGTWYQMPSDWRDAYGVNENDTTRFVSPTAYPEGLLWPAIGANPSGAKGPGYGTWADPPTIGEL